MDFAHLTDRIKHLGNHGELTKEDEINILACLEIAEASPLSNAFKKPDFKPVTDDMKDDNMKITQPKYPERADDMVY